MTSNIETKTKELDSIDLTGPEPIYETKVVTEEIDTINLVNEDGLDIERKISSKKCEICLMEESKYTCPACKINTCSLPCVTIHKTKSSCTGERDKTSFVPRKKFDNFNVLSDYRFLEEVNRVADNAKRDYRSKESQLGKQGSILHRAASRSGVKLFRMAKGMQRWRQNKSRFHIKEKVIHWTVKFVFDDNREEVISKFPETDTFQNALSSYINKEKATPENKLRFALYHLCTSLEDVCLLLEHELQGGDLNKRFTSVKMDSTLKESLTGKAILEYPIFHVVLKKTGDDLLQEPFMKGNCIPQVHLDDTDDCSPAKLRRTADENS